MAENELKDNTKDNKPLENQISIVEEKSSAISHKDSSLRRLDLSFNKHIEMLEYKKAHLLAYWIEDFSNYHDEETTFNPMSLKRYRRGDVIKVNLGFNVGAELGGLHYCVVLNKNDSMSSGTLTIVPLSSIKENKEYHHSAVNLGEELYKLLDAKFIKEYVKINKQLQTLDPSTSPMDVSKNLASKIIHLKKLNHEIEKMKSGSIALTSQITTISKQRIYNPKKNYDILSNIRLSQESSDKIDKKIHELFLKL